MNDGQGTAFIRSSTQILNREKFSDTSAIVKSVLMGYTASQPLLKPGECEEGIKSANFSPHSISTDIKTVAGCLNAVRCLQNDNLAESGRAGIYSVVSGASDIGASLTHQRRSAAEEVHSSCLLFYVYQSSSHCCFHNHFHCISLYLWQALLVDELRKLFDVKVPVSGIEHFASKATSTTASAALSASIMAKYGGQAEETSVDAVSMQSTYEYLFLIIFGPILLANRVRHTADYA